MQKFATLTAACLLTACASLPAPMTADPDRCDALAGEDWRRTAAPDVAAELLTLAHVETPPDRAVWYIAADGAQAACLPSTPREACEHVLHIFQPQIHRMWSWSEGAVRREACDVD
ncbi:hypothetical protein [Luteimonas sp. 3794]|uniref:hypothetical protein n=1 Tax=Luteimonas sp. 3794 TaxID=2817730 RepID=UPI00285DB43D|nr:hypothetical protein [Luteimonas sp. 3794]MDR6990565.1 hypothetical protein [Luteimonas sp. 3794]